MSDTALYVGMLFGAEPDGSYVEIRRRLRNGRGMGQDFYAVRDPRLPELIQAQGRTTDLYIGVGPRTRHEGTKAATERLHALYVDLDTPEAAKRLEGFKPSPGMVIRSGNGRHVYWPLWPPAGPDQAEWGNRRLAHALGGDMRATDAARILRPPGTFNHKGGDPVAVTIEHADPEALYTVEQVAGNLPDPPALRARKSQPVTPIHDADDPLQAIPPALYVEALTGRQVGRDGKVCCPLPGHEDRTPSLHVYDDAEAGWHCFGCGRGGTIIDFGAALFGIEPRGAGYHRIRDRLEAELRTRAAA